MEALTHPARACLFWPCPKGQLMHTQTFLGPVQYSTGRGTRGNRPIQATAIDFDACVGVLFTDRGHQSGETYFCALMAATLHRRAPKEGLRPWRRAQGVALFKIGQDCSDWRDTEVGDYIRRTWGAA